MYVCMYVCIYGWMGGCNAMACDVIYVCYVTKCYVMLWYAMLWYGMLCMYICIYVTQVCDACIYVSMYLYM